MRRRNCSWKYGPWPLEDGEKLGNVDDKPGNFRQCLQRTDINGTPNAWFIMFVLNLLFLGMASISTPALPRHEWVADL